MPRGDDEVLLRVGVTDLVAGAEPSLHALAGGGGSRQRALGQTAHRRYQLAAAEASPHFVAECVVRHELRVDGVRVLLHGRVDGLRQPPNGPWVVEELKSVAHLGEPGPQRRNAASRQVAIYAWLLGQVGTSAGGLPAPQQAIEAVLVWLPRLGDLPPKREPVAIDPAATEQFVMDALAARVHTYRQTRREREARRVAAPRVRFPHATPRSGQEWIQAAVTRALGEGEHLLIHAPTGIGKTAAVLAPTLRFALAEGKRVVHLTARRSQRPGVLATHAQLGATDAAPALLLAGKPELCANHAILCHPDLCRFARDHHRKVRASGLLESLLQSAIPLQPATVRDHARTVEACPHAVATALADRVALVVGDYNHALSPAAALDHFAPENASDVILVLDEVHQVAARARELASAQLTAAELADAAEQAGLGGAPIHRDLARVLSDATAWLESEVADAAHGGDATDVAIEHDVDDSRLTALRVRLEEVIGRYLAYRLETHSLEPEDAALRAWRSLERFDHVRESTDAPSVGIAERRDGAARLRVLCTDATPLLARLFDRCHGVIGMSATLAPIDLHRETLGLEAQRTGVLEVSNPFPPENRRVVIDPGVDTRLARRRRQAPRIAARIAALSHAVPGHCLAVFPSYAFLQLVASHLPNLAGPVLCEQPGAARSATDEILGRLRDPGAAGCLVLAVAGASLTEGVDFAGTGLRAVAIVGPCLPPRSVERELLRRHHDERFEAGFELAYAVPAMTRVVQAAGRLLRSEHDRGVIALLGRRFLERPWRDALPSDWLDGGTAEDRVGDAAEAARELFGAVASTPAGAESGYRSPGRV